MTSTPGNLTLRMIVVHDASSAQQTIRLLSERGHDVSATTLDEAGVMLDGNCDLLVVDSSEPEICSRVAELMSACETDRLPRRVAVFVDELDAAAKELRQRPGVHVFVRPLHVHGLLNVLRQL